MKHRDSLPHRGDARDRHNGQIDKQTNERTDGRRDVRWSLTLAEDVFSLSFGVLNIGVALWEEINITRRTRFYRVVWNDLSQNRKKSQRRCLLFIGLEFAAWFVARSYRRVWTFQAGLENASLCRRTLETWGYYRGVTFSQNCTIEIDLYLQYLPTNKIRFCA